MEPLGLPKDWVLKPALDLELKQYTLLAYLQRVERRFGEHKLYPYLEDVLAHTRELLHLRALKASLQRNLPGGLLGFDPRTGEAVHERPEDPDMLGVIDDVIDFAVPGLQRVWERGSGLRQELAEHIRFAPVGVQPLHVQEGWLLLRHGREARVYGYALPLLRTAQEELLYHSVHTRYVTSYTVGIACSYEHIKADLIDRHSAWPNPATFVLETDVPLPHIETFMPLAKQLVYEHIAKAA
jgi:hypothetical protein